MSTKGCYRSIHLRKQWCQKF